MNLEITRTVLRKDHREAGYHLIEEEHFLFLYDESGTRVGIFSADGATPASIQSEIDSLMNDKSPCNLAVS